jgi:DNA-binding MarR family transcriptional regulator
VPGTAPPPRDGDDGRFAFDRLDRVLHEKARLGLLTALLPHHDGLSFSELKQLCHLTDGNLARHLEKLEEADLIEIHKSHTGPRPKTTVILTTPGRTKFRDYLNELEAIVSRAIAMSAQLKPVIAGNEQG